MNRHREIQREKKQTVGSGVARNLQQGGSKAVLSLPFLPSTALPSPHPFPPYPSLPSLPSSSFPSSPSLPSKVGSLKSS